MPRPHLARSTSIVTGTTSRTATRPTATGAAASATTAASVQRTASELDQPMQAVTLPPIPAEYLLVKERRFVLHADLFAFAKATLRIERSMRSPLRSSECLCSIVYGHTFHNTIAH